MEELRSLVEKTKSGDLIAYGEIVRRFQDMVCGYAFSILGDFHLAQDAAQEAFLEAYRQLPDLKNPLAFPGWFRRIVFSRCTRFTERKKLPTVPLENAGNLPHPALDPEQAFEKEELREKILSAIRALPEAQRTVTTLFYINGYSEKDVSDFLEIPLTTVKKRLRDSRTRLKERMITMVQETLKNNVPDIRFRRNIIEKLLARPNLLALTNHPLRLVLDAIRSALPEYQFIETNDILEKSAVLAAGRNLELYYHLDHDYLLRWTVAESMTDLLPGRTPPVQLITAGRVYKPRNPSKEFPYHQAEVCCIRPDTEEPKMKATIEKILHAVCGPQELIWKQTDEVAFGRPFTRIYIKKADSLLSVVACGTMTNQELTETGFNPQATKGFRFGLGLETLAAIKFNLADKHALWLPPFSQ